MFSVQQPPPCPPRGGGWDGSSPLSTVEPDFGAAHGSRAADAADFRTARAVALDGQALRHGQSVHLHLERAAGFTVDREDAGDAAADASPKGIGLSGGEGEAYLHPSEELDPPVSTQVDEGPVDGELHSASRDQLHWSDRQHDVHDLNTNNSIHVCLGKQ